MSNCFVYSLIDPATDLPFYIGKGSRSDRPSMHLIETRETTSNLYKFNKIVNIRNSGEEPKIKILEENMTEYEALELEVKLIDFYGRRINGSGILTNLTAGGEGSSGYRHSEESLEKMRKSQIGRTHSEETKRKMSESAKRVIRTKERNLAISLAKKGQPLSDAQKLTISKMSQKAKEKSAIRRSNNETYKRKIDMPKLIKLREEGHSWKEISNLLNIPATSCHRYFSTFG